MEKNAVTNPKAKATKPKATKTAATKKKATKSGPFSNPMASGSRDDLSANTLERPSSQNSCAYVAEVVQREGRFMATQDSRNQGFADYLNAIGASIVAYSKGDTAGCRVSMRAAIAYANAAINTFEDGGVTLSLKNGE